LDGSGRSLTKNLNLTPDTTILYTCFAPATGSWIVCMCERAWEGSICGIRNHSLYLIKRFPQAEQQNKNIFLRIILIVLQNPFIDELQYFS